MLGLYIVTTIVGGVLILISALGGSHDTDHDIDHGHDGDFHSEIWLPFLSLRFWTYMFAFFGMTGLLLTYFTATSQTLTGVFAALCGLVAGTTIAFVMRYLSKSSSHSGAEERDLLGKPANVLVAIRSGSPGKIRVEVKGEMIDVMATTEETTPLEPGSEVYIVSMDNGRAQVISRTALLESKEINKNA